MTYEQLLEIIYERNLREDKVTLTEEEARSYYGDKLCNLIQKIYEFCKNSGYIIYQHATDVESANKIMTKGYKVSTDELDELPDDVKSQEPIDIEYDDKNVRTYIYNGKKCNIRPNGIRDELSDTQHFFENTNCNLNFGAITHPNVNRSGFGATCLFIVPKSITGSREYIQYGKTEPHFDDWEEKEIPETYFVRCVIPKQFCIGFLDVKKKEFVFNPNFQFNYGVTDEFELGISSQIQTDLSTIIQSNVGKKDRRK